MIDFYIPFVYKGLKITLVDSFLEAGLSSRVHNGVIRTNEVRRLIAIL